MFVLAGLILIFLFILNRFGNKNTSPLSKSIGFITILLSSYGATVIYILKNNLKLILLSYWEFMVFYIALMLIIGISVIGVMRGIDGSKHVLRISIKWLIRLSGLILLYNSSSSPKVSLSIIAISTVIYIIRSFIKRRMNKIIQKKKRN